MSSAPRTKTAAAAPMAAPLASARALISTSALASSISSLTRSWVLVVISCNAEAIEELRSFSSSSGVGILVLIGRAS